MVVIRAAVELVVIHAAAQLIDVGRVERLAQPQAQRIGVQAAEDRRREGIVVIVAADLIRSRLGVQRVRAQPSADLSARF